MRRDFLIRILCLALPWVSLPSDAATRGKRHPAPAPPPEPPGPPSDSELKALNQALADVEAKRYARAEGSLRRLAKSRNPRTAVLADQGLASLYRLKGDYRKVVQAYESALSRKVSGAADVRVMQRLAGQAAVMASDYGAAVRHLSAWRRRLPAQDKADPSYATALAFLAVAQAETHRFKDARRTIETAVAAMSPPSHGLLSIRDAIRAAASSRGRFRKGSIAALVQ